MKKFILGIIVFSLVNNFLLAIGVILLGLGTPDVSGVDPAEWISEQNIEKSSHYEREQRYSSNNRQQQMCWKCHKKSLVQLPEGHSFLGKEYQIRISMFSKIKVHKYVCYNCGCVEERVDKDDLLELRKMIE